MDKIPFDRVIWAEFQKYAFLTPEEIAVIETRFQTGWSQTAQCHELNMSPATFNRRMHSIIAKYESVKKYSDLLPDNVDFGASSKKNKKKIRTK